MHKVYKFGTTDYKPLHAHFPAVPLLVDVRTVTQINLEVCLTSAIIFAPGNACLILIIKNDFSKIVG